MRAHCLLRPRNASYADRTNYSPTFPRACTCRRWKDRDRHQSCAPTRLLSSAKRYRAEPVPNALLDSVRGSEYERLQHDSGPDRGACQLVPAARGVKGIPPVPHTVTTRQYPPRSPRAPRLGIHAIDTGFHRIGCLGGVSSLTLSGTYRGSEIGSNGGGSIRQNESRCGHG